MYMLLHLNACSIKLQYIINVLLTYINNVQENTTTLAHKQWINGIATELPMRMQTELVIADRNADTSGKRERKYRHQSYCLIPVM